MCCHCWSSRLTSRRSSSAVAPSAAVRTMMPWPGGAHVVEDLAEALALVVGQALGDPVGRAVRHQHHEPAGQRHLLGEPGALGADRVLGDLAEHGLAGTEQLLDAGRCRGRVLLAVDVVGVVLDVAPVEHRVLGGADVDERRLHARQHVLDLAQVDVAVDVDVVVGRAGHVVLDERPSLEHGDLGGVGADVHAHEVAADGPALALPAPAPLEGLLVELDRVLVVRRVAVPGARSARRRHRHRRLGPGRRACGGAWPPPTSCRRRLTDPFPGSSLRVACAGPAAQPAGRRSPILGLSPDLAGRVDGAGRPSRGGSGRSGFRSSDAAGRGAPGAGSPRGRDGPEGEAGG